MVLRQILQATVEPVEVCGEVMLRFRQSGFPLKTRIGFESANGWEVVGAGTSSLAEGWEY